MEQEAKELNQRKHYIDNIRWTTVVLVIVYHLIYNFNCSGVIKNIAVEGIPQMDAFLVFVYPWFMCLLFVIGGMSARYSLNKRTGKEFAKQRAKGILVPSIAGMIAFGWISGWVTTRYTDIFMGAGDLIPTPIKFMIYTIIGIGPMWFAHELFLASMILLLLRAIDKKDRIWNLGGKVKLWLLLLFALPVWGSSFLLITPMIEIYRNGIYIFMFLLGYYVFSHEEITDTLAKFRWPLLIVSLITGVVYVVFWYGENYTTRECLQSFFTNFYAWIAILAIIGCFKAWFNKKNKVTEYMVKRNFAFYVLHYSLIILLSYFVLTYLNLPMAVNYIVILILEAICLALAYEILSRIPVLRFLLLGITKEKRKAGQEI